MKADVIVLTYGNEDMTCRCFRALRKHTSGYRLVWLDNGSGSDSIDVVLPEAAANSNMVPIWLPRNIGFVKGCNVALELLLQVFDTDADYIVLLNNDVEVTDGWLDRMRQVMNRDIRLGAVGPVTSECSSWQSYLHARKMLPVFQIPAGFERLGTGERAERLAYAYGELSAKCNMLAFFCTIFRTEVFKELGYLDERFGIGYGEDDDFCKRLRDSKREIAVSLGTYVFHNHQSTFKRMYSDDEIRNIKKQRLEAYKEKHGEDAKV